MAEWDRRCVAEARAGLLLERQVEKKRKELQKQLAEENRQLAMEQKARWEGVVRLVHGSRGPTAQHTVMHVVLILEFGAYVVDIHTYMPSHPIHILPDSLSCIHTFSHACTGRST